MGAGDWSRVIGWGPFALPGERASMARARVRARDLLTDAGVIGQVEPVPAGRVPTEDAAVFEFGPRMRERRGASTYRNGGEISLIGEETEDELPRGEQGVVYLVDRISPPEPTYSAAARHGTSLDERGGEVTLVGEETADEMTSGVVIELAPPDGPAGG